MGNTQQMKTMSDDYQIVQENYFENILLVYSKKTNEEYLGRKASASTKEEIDKMDRIIDYKNTNENKYISKLIYTHKYAVGYCNFTVQYLFLFEKGAFSLKEEIYNRRFKYQTFHQAQIMIILQSVMKGLLSLKELKIPHKRICTQNIYIREDRSIFLSDPWLFGGKQTSIYKMNETGYIYPSPQKILHENDLINQYDFFLSDYYSLGIVLIELANMEPMDSLYEKGFRRIMEKQLVKHINKIKRKELRDIIMILVSHSPQKRKEVEKYYSKQTNASNFIHTEVNRFKSKISRTVTMNAPQEEIQQQQEKPIKMENNYQVPALTHIIPEKNRLPKISFSYKQQVKTRQAQKFIIPPQKFFQLKKSQEIEAKKQSFIDQCQVNNSLQLYQQQKQKIKQFHNLIKQAQSINASSFDDKSQIASQVIGHGFSAKNSYSIGVNSKPEPIDLVRTSLPIKSLQEQNINTTNLSKSNIQAEQKPKNNFQQGKSNTLTPDRPVKKRNHSTIKEVSQESPSFDQIQCEERTIQYDVGTKYIGQLRNGKRNGKGVFYFADGSFYQGSWKQNKMHGKGSLYYSNGHIAYDGGWYMDSFHGKGRIYNDNPRQLQTQFNYNNMNLIDGYWQVYDGDFFNEKKNGKGKLKLSNGEVFVGQFKEDKINGQGKFYQLSGNIIFGKWFQGILVKQYAE